LFDRSNACWQTFLPASFFASVSGLFFAIRIADMLLEPEKFRELYPVLEKVGFQP
jgi:hypothetical protein